MTSFIFIQNAIIISLPWRTRSWVICLMGFHGVETPQLQESTMNLVQNGVNVSAVLALYSGKWHPRCLQKQHAVWFM